MTSSSRITVDPGIRGDLDQSFAAYIETADVARAKTAVEAAAPRLFRVTEDGEELPSDEALDAAGDSVCTPSFVHDPVELRDAVIALVDTDGETPGPMAGTMVRILEEELSRAGVATAHIREATPADVGRAQS